MAHTKNPDRYPPEYHQLLDSLASKTFSPKTVTYPNHKTAVNARQMLLAFRAALKHRSLNTPTPYTLERYQLALTLTTSLTQTLDGTTLSIATSLSQAPLWADCVAAQAEPEAAPLPVAETEAAIVDKQMAEYYSMVGDRLIKELENQLFLKTFKQHNLPETPQLAINYTFDLFPNFEINLKMEEIISELAASDAPIRIPPAKA